MKKTLLLVLGLTFCQVSFGQVFVTEDFSGFTIGNIGTDLTGVTPGQGNFLTTATNGVAPTTTTNTDNSNFQIVNDVAEFGQVLQITGPNGDKGNRIMWEEGLDAAWTSRTVGNDIMEVEYNFYTGDATTSLNTMRMYLYDATKTKILVGFTFASNTKIIQGVGYYDATAQPGGMITNYGFFLGTPVGTTPQHVTLPANTWVRIGMSYNYATGQLKWKGPGFNTNAQVPGAAAMTNVDELNIVSTSGSAPTATPPVINTSAATGLFDNIVARASATDTLLGVNEVNAANTGITVYPNPFSNVLNLSGNLGMNMATITDINGRVVSTVLINGMTETQLNVSDLASGIYMIEIQTENGSIVKKIVK